MSAAHDRVHAITDSIIGSERQNFGAVSHQAVCDGLAALTVAGPVRRSQPMGPVAACEAQVEDKRHHVVCRSCGAIADVDGTVGDTACLTVPDDLPTASARPRSSARFYAEVCRANGVRRPKATSNHGGTARQKGDRRD
jgi:Fur family transcriptional regulator, stress-responsive regulator